MGSSRKGKVRLGQSPCIRWPSRLSLLRDMSEGFATVRGSYGTRVEHETWARAVACQIMYSLRPVGFSIFSDPPRTRRTKHTYKVQTLRRGRGLQDPKRRELYSREHEEDDVPEARLRTQQTSNDLLTQADFLIRLLYIADLIVGPLASKGLFLEHILRLKAYTRNPNVPLPLTDIVHLLVANPLTHRHPVCRGNTSNP